MRIVALLVSALALALPARAETVFAPAPTTKAQKPGLCRILPSTGEKFCKYGHRWKLENPPPSEFAVGDAFPIETTSMLIDLDRYRLPAVDGPWRYYVRDRVIYKVSAATGRVIEVVGRARTR